MLEFSDEIYDSLVEPMKKNRTFSKLIVSLINGYIADGYIHAYVDDTLDDLKRAAVDSFNSSIDSMSESLSNMGLFTDELDSMSSSAKTKFKDKAKEVAEDSKGAKPTNTEDIDKINKRIDDMQEDVNAKLSVLIDLISSLKSDDNLSVKKNVENVNPEFSSVKKNVENVRPDISNVKKNVENVNPEFSNVKKNVENVETNLDSKVEEDEDALNFMSNLLDGNSFEF
jgi:methyl-accepting chemotaxis protein